MKYILHFLAITLLIACNTSEQATEDDTTSQDAPQVSQTESDLHDIWALEWMAGIEMDSAEFMNGVPTLELYPKDSSVIGHSGCNRLNGKIILSTENGLSFDKLATTKMLCPDNYEAVFLDNLTKTSRYSRQELKLLFLQDDMVVMRFKKVD